MNIHRAPDPLEKEPKKSLTLMIARTAKGGPVWQSDGKGRPFIIDHQDGSTIIKLGVLWWWRWWPVKGRIRMMPKPHLSWRQVAYANMKGKIVLKALRLGPIYLHKGFLKGRDSRVLTTRALAAVVLPWLEGCGVALTRHEQVDGRVRIDIDVEQTQRNKVQ